MKSLIQLGLLAALACGSAYGNPVSFTGTNAGASSITASGLVVKGFYTTGVNNWNATDVTQDSLGIGVYSQNANFVVEGEYKEYLTIDFGATATGTVTVNSLVLNFPNTETSPYFKYAWISALPAGTSPSLTGLTTNWTTPGTPGTGDLVSFGPLAGQGRYLLIGAINGSQSTTNVFALNGVAYTSVPDGASTLALMGAAVATLGLAARRRKQ
jgi:hypothetical protein